MDPRSSCPVPWPAPQSAPSSALCTLDRPIVKGASDAKWSGPVIVCRQPVTRPVHAVCIKGWNERSGEGPVGEAVDRLRERKGDEEGLC